MRIRKLIEVGVASEAAYGHAIIAARRRMKGADLALIDSERFRLFVRGKVIKRNTQGPRAAL
ncbi:MAG: hypothetical protein ABI640_03360 [Gammaproteobacteria bacterium]